MKTQRMCITLFLLGILFSTGLSVNNRTGREWTLVEARSGDKYTFDLLVVNDESVKYADLAKAKKDIEIGREFGVVHGEFERRKFYKTMAIRSWERNHCFIGSGRFVYGVMCDGEKNFHVKGSINLEKMLLQPTGSLLAGALNLNKDTRHTIWDAHTIQYYALKGLWKKKTKPVRRHVRTGDTALIKKLNEIIAKPKWTAGSIVRLNMNESKYRRYDLKRGDIFLISTDLPPKPEKVWIYRYNKRAFEKTERHYSKEKYDARAPNESWDNSHNKAFTKPERYSKEYHEQSHSYHPPNSSNQQTRPSKKYRYAGLEQKAKFEYPEETYYDDTETVSSILVDKCDFILYQKQ